MCLSNYHPGCYILVEHGSAAFTSIVASINSIAFLFYVSNYILNISKQLLVQTLTDHVPLNGCFLLRQPIKYLRSKVTWAMIYTCMILAYDIGRWAHINVKLLHLFVHWSIFFLQKVQF